MAMISIVAFDGENADICKNRDVRFVSPSELSKLQYSLVIVSKLKKGRETKHMFLRIDVKINFTKLNSYFSFFQGVKAANIDHI